MHKHLQCTYMLPAVADSMCAVCKQTLKQQRMVLSTAITPCSLGTQKKQQSTNNSAYNGTLIHPTGNKQQLLPGNMHGWVFKRAVA